MEIDFADSAETATDQIRLRTGLYTVVLSDIQLAEKKSGVDLVNECYFGMTNVPFVLTSGQRGFNSRWPFLKKPLRYDSFAETLSPYLDENAPSANERTGKTQILRPKKEKGFEQFAFVAVAALFQGFACFWATTEFRHLPLSSSVLR
ncbi:MAG: hypothetical protein H7301_09150 [Cryobacterium sp.]|nr:hypothetical protein [Oligoflexia bacterium]